MSISDQKAVEMMMVTRRLADSFMHRQNALETTNRPDLTKHAGFTIMILGENGHQAMSELAEKLRLSVSSATLIVDRLVEKGLLSRHRSSEDRRVVRVGLTAAGDNVFKVEQEVMLKFGHAILDALSEQEQDLLLTLLRKVSTTLTGEASKGLSSSLR